MGARLLVTVSRVASVCAMASVSPMHEEVHERTSQDREPEQGSQNMGTMLREQKHAADGEEAGEDNRRARGQKAFLARLSMIMD